MSEKSVAQKLGLKTGRALLVRHAPAPIGKIVGAVPDGAEITETGAGRFPLVLVFAKDRSALIKELPGCKAKLEAGGALDRLRQGDVQQGHGYQSRQHPRICDDDGPRYGFPNRHR